MSVPPVPFTLSELTRLLPAAHIEAVGDDDELVIYTGLTVDESADDPTTLRWIDGMFGGAA